MSDPRMGFWTSARMKECTTLRPGRAKKIFRFPKVLIEVPLAAHRVTEEGNFF